MQVERSPQGDSGERVRNAWVTYPRDRDSIVKAVVIPDDPRPSHDGQGKDGLDRKVAVTRGGARVPSASW